MPFMKRAIFCAAAGACCITAHSAYYFRPNGNNLASGKSFALAWKDFDALGGVTLAPSDTIYLQADTIFSNASTLYLSEANYPAYSESSPLVITTWPVDGRPAIISISVPDGRGISLYNTGGVHIRNLVIRGPGAAVSINAGIDLYTDKPANTRIRSIQIDSCEVSGFRNGLSFGATPTDQSSSGFTGLSVEPMTALK